MTSALNGFETMTYNLNILINLNRFFFGLIRSQNQLASSTKKFRRSLYYLRVRVGSFDRFQATR